MPPTFKEQLSDVKIPTNTNLDLSVTVDGFPEPTLEWSKDDKLLVKSNKCNISNEGQISKLQISTMTEADEGLYSVAAKNCVGEISSSCKALVEGNLMH